MYCITVPKCDPSGCVVYLRPDPAFDPVYPIVSMDLLACEDARQGCLDCGMQAVTELRNSAVRDIFIAVAHLRLRVGR